MAYRETERGKARKAKTRQQILQATAELVDESGFGLVQMAQIADRAGIAAGTLYRYFASKEALFADYFRLATEQEVRQVAAALQQPGLSSERVETGLRVFARRALLKPRTAWALIAEPVDPAVDEQRLLYRQRYARLFEQVISFGMESGELPPQDARLTSTAMVGALAEALVGPLAEPLTDHDATIDHIIAFCLAGLTRKEYPR